MMGHYSESRSSLAISAERRILPMTSFNTYLASVGIGMINRTAPIIIHRSTPFSFLETANSVQKVEECRMTIPSRCSKACCDNDCSKAISRPLSRFSAESFEHTEGSEIGVGFGTINGSLLFCQVVETVESA